MKYTAEESHLAYRLRSTNIAKPLAFTVSAVVIRPINSLTIAREL